MVALPPLRSDPRCPPELLLRSIVTFRYTSYDSTSGIPTLIELRFVGDRPDDVAGVEAERRSECRECCDEHRDDDFQNLFPVHSWLVLGYISGALLMGRSQPLENGLFPSPLPSASPSGYHCFYGVLSPSVALRARAPSDFLATRARLTLFFECKDRGIV